MNPEEKRVEVILKDDNNLNFNYKTSLQKAAQIIAFLSLDENVTLSNSDVSLATIPASVSKANVVAGSPIEMMRESNANTYPQKIAALGYFIVERDGRETFDPKEVLTLLRRMGDMPRNFNRDLRNAELVGYISKEQNGEYFLTDSAKENVANQFNAAVPASGASRKKRAKRATTVAKV